MDSPSRTLQDASADPVFTAEPPGEVAVWLSWASVIGWLFALLVFAAVCTTGAERPRVAVSDALSNGPMVVRGSLGGPPGRRSPTGRQAAAWRSWVRSDADPGATIFTPLKPDLCVSEALDGLFVTDGRATLLLSPEFFERRSDGGASFGGGWDAYLVAGAAMPAGVTCERPPEPGPPRYFSPRYYEVVLPAGVAVEVSGCRAGQEIRPCRDGADGVSTAPIATSNTGLRVPWPRSALQRWLRWIGWCLFGLGALGWAVSKLAGSPTLDLDRYRVGGGGRR